MSSQGLILAQRVLYLQTHLPGPEIFVFKRVQMVLMISRVQGSLDVEFGSHDLT